MNKRWIEDGLKMVRMQKKYLEFIKKHYTYTQKWEGGTSGVFKLWIGYGKKGGGQFQIALKTPNREKKLRKKTTSIRCTYSGRQTDQSQSKDSARGEVSLL